MLIKPIRFKHKLLVIMIAGVTTSSVYADDGTQTTATIDEKEVIQLDTIVVTSNNTTEKKAAQQTLKQVSGGVNFVDSTEVEHGRVASNADLFSNQPGVYAQSAGNEGVKISIRGSGINRGSGAHASGLYVLLDDIPFTGPGGTPYELLDPSWLNYTEVYRGANGFDKGSVALGGAINYVTKTGKNAPALELKYEVGSYGYQKGYVGFANQLDKLDYYVAITGSKYDGYQDHASGDSKGIASNIGYQITPDIETRFYLRYRETFHQTPGRLTKQQIKDNPRQANATNILYDAQRPQPGSTFIANKTTINFSDATRLNFGLAYHDYPMDLNEGIYRTVVDYRDFNAFIDLAHDYSLFGKPSTISAAIHSSQHLPGSGVNESQRVQVGDYPAGTKTRKYTYEGSDTTFQLNHKLAFTPELSLNTGLAIVYAERGSEVFWPETNRKLEQDDVEFAPRIGLNYQVNDDVLVYGNLSRSVEPPHPWSLIWGSNIYFPAGSGAATGRQMAAIPLENQTANTIEVGGRGESKLGQWDLSYYYSKVKNELLSVEIQAAPNQIIAENNASPTIHQGVEAGLTSTLFEKNHIGKITFKQSYTYSDFRYKNDELFGKAHLAGIPKHFYQAELRYSHPNGFFAGLNTEYASKIPIDYANTVYTDAYNIYGISLGYAAPTKPWQTWLDFRNIGDKHYAATVTPGFNDQGKEVARLTPGEGFGVYAGVSYRFD